MPDSHPTDQPGNLESSKKFNELMETTYEMAKKLLPFLARQRVPLTPYNYRLFYDYFINSNLELKKALDNVLLTGTLFTSEISDTLYHQFYQEDYEQAQAVNQVSERIGSISQSLEKNLEKGLGSTDRFKQVLTETAQEMEGGDLGGHNMKSIMDRLMLETQSALTSQTDLAGQMEKSNKLIASLTAELRDQTRLANIDELTQLYNRRFMTQRFAQLIADFKPEVPLCMIMFDLDKFKNVNDTWGHAIGDKVLIICAKIIQRHSGDKYLAVRFGGEEFMVLCPGLDKDGAFQLAESIRKSMADTEVTVRGQNIPVTISCGVSQYVKGETDVECIARADQALYKAKETGRNRVVLADDNAVPLVKTK